MAEKRKGGKRNLKLLIPKPLSKRKQLLIGDDRYLSMMAKCVFQAGFKWSIIENKWGGFEEAFFGFDLQKLSALDMDQWYDYTKDKRIVRNGMKIKTVMQNTKFVAEVIEEYGSFAKLIANWPESDLIGLWSYIKNNGSRLGGNTGQYFLRAMGKDSFILSRDVTTALRHADIDIRDHPTTKLELQLAQDAFNNWHDETGLSYTSLSKILAFSIGVNYDNEDSII